MDFNEIIQTAQKRPRQDDLSDANGNAVESSLPETQKNDIDELVDSAQPLNLDLSSAKRMVLKFEKTLKLNSKLRSKHFNDPSKFVDSEADLDTEIKQVSLFCLILSLLSWPALQSSIRN
jgi:beta-catenin-like protein 1